MSGFKYVAAQNMKVYDHESEETIEVAVGDEIKNAEQWHYLGAYLRNGTVVRVEADATSSEPVPVEEPQEDEAVEEEVTEEATLYECDLCEFTTEHEAGLKRHVTMVHKDDEPDEDE